MSELEDQIAEHVDIERNVLAEKEKLNDELDRQIRNVNELRDTVARLEEDLLKQAKQQQLLEKVGAMSYGTRMIRILSISTIF